MVTLEEIKSLLEENNKRRDENLDKKLFQLKVDLNESINQRVKHFKPSKDTKEQLDDFKQNCAKVSGEYGAEIKRLAVAMEANQIMTKKMYEVYTNANWSGKLLLKIFTVLGITTGAIIGLIELIKRMR